MSVLTFLSRALERALDAALESPERHDMALLLLNLRALVCGQDLKTPTETS